MFKCDLPHHCQLSQRSLVLEPNARQIPQTNLLFKLQSACRIVVKTKLLVEALNEVLVVNWNAPPTPNSCNDLTEHRVLPPQQLQTPGPNLSFAYPNPLQVEARVRSNQIHFGGVKLSEQEPSLRDFQR